MNLRIEIIVMSVLNAELIDNGNALKILYCFLLCFYFLAINGSFYKRSLLYPYDNPLPIVAEKALPIQTLDNGGLASFCSTWAWKLLPIH